MRLMSYYSVVVSGLVGDRMFLRVVPESANIKKNCILVNAFGIRDSGGISVLKKVIEEFLNCSKYRYIIVCNLSKNALNIEAKYKKYKHIDFVFVDSNSFLYRLYYENFKFSKIIDRKKVLLIYNFSGSAQVLSKAPQLIKVHNLLFFSKKLEKTYFKKRMFFTWVRQVFFKRQVFKFMIKVSKFIEIQSCHVKGELENFASINKKKFYIKSDVLVDRKSFQKPKRYNFLKKIKFLYIVGPHFESLHKNFTFLTFHEILLTFLTFLTLWTDKFIKIILII